MPRVEELVVGHLKFSRLMLRLMELEVRGEWDDIIEHDLVTDEIVEVGEEIVNYWSEMPEEIQDMVASIRDVYMMHKSQKPKEGWYGENA